MIALLLAAVLQAEGGNGQSGPLADEALEVGRLAAALEMCRPTYRFAPEVGRDRIDAFQERARANGWSDVVMETTFETAKQVERDDLGAQDTFAGMSWDDAWGRHVAYRYRLRERCREIASHLPGSLTSDELRSGDANLHATLANPNRSALLGHPTVEQGLGRLPNLPRNALAQPNTVDFWPSPMTDQNRWLMNAPLGKTPFVIVATWGQQIAVRSAMIEGRYDSDSHYYVAMRQTPDRLEEADSRDCAFGHLVKALRDKPVPEIIIPGTEPRQEPPEPQFHGTPTSITLRRARQSDRQEADIIISASHGDVVAWAGGLVQATADCWGPMTPPPPLPPRPSS